MATPARARSATPRRELLRTLLIVVLVAVGVIWPLVNIGPRGETLVVITPNHGIDIGDLAGIIPIALALLLARSRTR
jgi:hypothetical protein